MMAASVTKPVAVKAGGTFRVIDTSDGTKVRPRVVATDKPTLIVKDDEAPGAVTKVIAAKADLVDRRLNVPPQPRDIDTANGVQRTALSPRKPRQLSAPSIASKALFQIVAGTDGATFAVADDAGNICICTSRELAERVLRGLS